MLENDLGVAVDGPAHFLPLRQQKDGASFLLIVESVCWVGKDLFDVKSSAIVDLKEGNTATIGVIWHSKKLDSLQSLDGWRLDLMSIEGLKVVEVA